MSTHNGLLQTKLQKGHNWTNSFTPRVRLQLISKQAPGLRSGVSTISSNQMTGRQSQVALANLTLVSILI